MPCRFAPLVADRRLQALVRQAHRPGFAELIFAVGGTRDSATWH